MTADPVKYFEHHADRHRTLSLHRLDEVVMVILSSGPDDEMPETMFLGPTAVRALANALRTAARDAQAVFDAGNTPQLASAAAGPPARYGLVTEWSPAFTFSGLPYSLCPAGDGRVGPGEMAKVESSTRRIWHDDCAEEAGAYRQSQPSEAARTP